MDPKSAFFCQALLLSLMVGLAASTTSFISDVVFESHGSLGRNLLQTKKACPVNFEFMNYTIITSKCKGPQYPAKLCCDGLKEFACPYTDAINDGTTDCASTMFSYINLYGKYPPGLFASECKEGKEGLACTPELIAQKSELKSTSAAHITQTSPFALTSVVSTIILGFLFS